MSFTVYEYCPTCLKDYTEIENHVQIKIEIEDNKELFVYYCTECFTQEAPPQLLDIINILKKRR